MKKFMDILEVEDDKLTVLAKLLSFIKLYKDEDEWAGYDDCLNKVNKSIDGQENHIALKSLMVTAISVYQRSGSDRDQWMKLCEICWKAYAEQKKE